MAPIGAEPHNGIYPLWDWQHREAPPPARG